MSGDEVIHIPLHFVILVDRRLHFGDVNIVLCVADICDDKVFDFVQRNIRNCRLENLEEMLIIDPKPCEHMVFIFAGRKQSDRNSALLEVFLKFASAFCSGSFRDGFQCPVLSEVPFDVEVVLFRHIVLGKIKYHTVAELLPVDIIVKVHSQIAAEGFVGTLVLAVMEFAPQIRDDAAVGFGTGCGTIEKPTRLAQHHNLKGVNERGFAGAGDACKEI